MSSKLLKKNVYTKIQQLDSNQINSEAYTLHKAIHREVWRTTNE